MEDADQSNSWAGSSSLDSMSSNSRAFYERSLDKLMWSIFAGVMSLVALGFSAWSGGMSSFSGYLQERSGDDDDEANEAIRAGSGFACFLFFVCFCIYLFSAIYISPVLCGSDNEKSILWRPEELPSTQSV